MRSSVFSGLFIENAEQFPPMHDFRTLSKISWQGCEDLLPGSLLCSIDFLILFVIGTCCFISTALYCTLKTGRLVLSFFTIFAQDTFKLTMLLALNCLYCRRDIMLTLPLGD